VAGNFFIIRIWEKCYGTCDVISLFDFSGDSNPHVLMHILFQEAKQNLDVFTIIHLTSLEHKLLLDKVTSFTVTYGNTPSWGTTLKKKKKKTVERILNKCLCNLQSDVFL